MESAPAGPCFLNGVAGVFQAVTSFVHIDVIGLASWSAPAAGAGVQGRPIAFGGIAHRCAHAGVEAGLQGANAGCCIASLQGSVEALDVLDLAHAVVARSWNPKISKASARARQRRKTENVQSFADDVDHCGRLTLRKRYVDSEKSASSRVAKLRSVR